MSFGASIKEGTEKLQSTDCSDWKAEAKKRENQGDSLSCSPGTMEVLLRWASQGRAGWGAEQGVQAHPCGISGARATSVGMCFRQEEKWHLSDGRAPEWETELGCC